MSRRWYSGQRSLKVIESGTFDRLCIATLSVRLFLRYLTSKNSCDLENQVSGPSRSLDMSPFNRAYMTFYWRSVVTMALPRVISEIFNVEKYRNLEIPVKGQSRSLNVVPGYDRYGFLLVFYSNFVPKTNRFWDIRLAYSDLETRDVKVSRPVSVWRWSLVTGHYLRWCVPPLRQCWGLLHKLAQCTRPQVWGS